MVHNACERDGDARVGFNVSLRAPGGEGRSGKGARRFGVGRGAVLVTAVPVEAVAVFARAVEFGVELPALAGPEEPWVLAWVALALVVLRALGGACWRAGSARSGSWFGGRVRKDHLQDSAGW